MQDNNNIINADEADEIAAIIAAATTRTTSPYANGSENQQSIRRRAIAILESMSSPFDLDPPVIIDPNATLTNPFAHLYPSSDEGSTDIQQVIDQTFFGARPHQPIQMPTQGQNAKILSELSNFDTNSIPAEFCCPLSGEIMDDPVYDSAHPQYKFERQCIERSVQKKAENPYTRTPLSKTQLIPDAQLKNRIVDYMKRTTGQNTFCGLKS